MTLSRPDRIHLRWTTGTTSVTWTYRHASVSKNYPAPPQTVAVWADPPSIIVVESQTDEQPRPDNAVVYNPDGSARLRLRPPVLSTEPSRYIGFYGVWAEPGGLVAVFTTRADDF